MAATLGKCCVTTERFPTWLSFAARHLSALRVAAVCIAAEYGAKVWHQIARSFFCLTTECSRKWLDGRGTGGRSLRLSLLRRWAVGWTASLES